MTHGAQRPRLRGITKFRFFPEATAHYPGNAELRRAFWSALEQTKPDVVAVNGWNNFGSVIAANCCVRRGIPMVVMSESSHQDEPRTWWKEAIKRRIVGLYSAALVGGQRHVEYLAELGMPRERIFTGYDVVDNEYFRQKAQEVRNQKSDVRKKYGLAGELLSRLSAVHREKESSTLDLSLRGISAEIVRQGDRSQKSEVGQRKKRRGISCSWATARCRTDLCRLISDLRLHEHVHLPGFKPYDELPVYYALANAFVHASTTEQWGLVVNEAIASGLPVIVSDRCGCVPELVNGNGFTFDPTNEHELAARLLEMASLSDEERKRLGDNSYRIAANFAPERFGEGLERAASVAMGVPQKRFGVMDRALLLVTASYAR